jgi:hypothetical protein
MGKTGSKLEPGQHNIEPHQLGEKWPTGSLHALEPGRDTQK